MLFDLQSIAEEQSRGNTRKEIIRPLFARGFMQSLCIRLRRLKNTAIRWKYTRGLAELLLHLDGRKGSRSN
jgi:hypothetical protein